MIRTIDMIERDIREAEALSASESGNRAVLYKHRVEALKVELRAAEARREAMQRVAKA